MLADQCLAAARAIAADVAALDHGDGSLRGTAAALVLWHELGSDAPKLARPIRRWEDATRASLFELDAAFFDGMLGSAWALACTGRGRELGAIDDAVLDVMIAPWPGGLAPFGGGLAGFGLYGLSRMRTRRGRQIVERCVTLFEAHAIRTRGAIRWPSHAATLPGEVTRMTLLNMEGSSAAVGFLGAAAVAGVRAALPIVKTGARTLALDLDARSAAEIGTAVAHAAPGLVHGSGTWALGSAGAVSALLSAARATRARRDLDAAARFGRKLANLDPLACDAIDASLGSGSSGIACVMQSLFAATREPVFRFAAEHWLRRTLNQRSSHGLGGFQHFEPLRDAFEGGSRWAPRAGLLEGATGTALALLGAVRRVRSTSWCSG